MAFNPLKAYVSVVPPKDTWNLSKDGKYEFSGKANSSKLYTNYYFNGASKVKIYLLKYLKKEQLFR